MQKGFIFSYLWHRGRSGELIYYWHYVGADKNTMAREYVEQLKMMEQSMWIYLIDTSFDELGKGVGAATVIFYTTFFLVVVEVSLK